MFEANAEAEQDMKRNVLERQLETAKSKLESRVSTLKGSGLGEDAYAGDPKWRTLDATRRQLTTLLGAVAKIEKREADAIARKENPEGAEAAE